MVEAVMASTCPPSFETVSGSFGSLPMISPFSPFWNHLSAFAPSPGVSASEGVTKIYDVKPLFAKWAAFKALEDDTELFYNVEVDKGGYGIIWNDDLDLSCN